MGNETRKKPLDATQRAECARLKAAWEAYQLANAGATQEWLASCLKVSQGALSHYLNGRNALNLEIVARVCAELRVPPAAIGEQYDTALSRVAALYPEREFADLTKAERDLLAFIRREGRTGEKRESLATRMMLMALTWLGKAAPDSSVASAPRRKG